MFNFTVYKCPGCLMTVMTITRLKHESECVHWRFGKRHQVLIPTGDALQAPMSFPPPRVEEEDDVCSVCWEVTGPTGRPVTKLDCSHKFHTRCIAHWHKRKQTCPMCRKPVLAVNNDLGFLVIA